jgi:hypothetical protein
VVIPESSTHIKRSNYHFPFWLDPHQEIFHQLIQLIISSSALIMNYFSFITHQKIQSSMKDHQKKKFFNSLIPPHQDFLNPFLIIYSSHQQSFTSHSIIHQFFIPSNIMNHFNIIHPSIILSLTM